MAFYRSGGGGNSNIYIKTFASFSTLGSDTIPLGFKAKQFLIDYDLSGLNVHVVLVYDVNDTSYTTPQYIQISNGAASIQTVGGSNAQIQAFNDTGITLYSNSSQPKVNVSIVAIG